MWWRRGEVRRRGRVEGLAREKMMEKAQQGKEMMEKAQKGKEMMEKAQQGKEMMEKAQQGKEMTATAMVAVPSLKENSAMVVIMQV
jgi:hypothetical protein